MIDVAVVKGQMTRTGSIPANTAIVKLLLRFTDIFIPRQGKWMVRAPQLTSVKGG